MKGRWYQAWASIIVGIYCAELIHEILWVPVMAVAVFALTEALRPLPVPKRSHHKKKPAL